MSLKSYLKEKQTEQLAKSLDLTRKQVNGETTNEENTELKITNAKLEIYTEIIKFCQERNRY